MRSVWTGQFPVTWRMIRKASYSANPRVMPTACPALSTQRPGFAALAGGLSCAAVMLAGRPVTANATAIASHGCGMSSLVPPLAKAAIAAGADGLLVEVHPNPEQALSDGAQSLLPEQFGALMKDIARYAQLEGRYV